MKYKRFNKVQIFILFYDILQKKIGGFNNEKESFNMYKFNYNFNNNRNYNFFKHEK